MSDQAILSLVVILVSLAAVSVVVRIAIKVRSKTTDNSNRVKQHKNRVHGDQAGRDINKNGSL